MGHEGDGGGIAMSSSKKRQYVHTLAQFELGGRDGVGGGMILLQQGGRGIEERERDRRER